MNEFELEDYPLETKTIFDVKNLESSVLWIRVDPDMEYIRKVKVNQDTNNWLFQLLLEKDIIGQIEAIK
jgi:transcription initiation factor TFIID subunit 2